MSRSCSYIGRLAPAPNNEKGDNPNAWYTEAILSGKWDVSDAEGPMLKAFMKKYNIQPLVKAPKSESLVYPDLAILSETIHN